MTPPRDLVQQFATRVAPAFRSALINRDRDKEGDFYPIVIREHGNTRSFEYRLTYLGQDHWFRGELTDAGNVAIETSMGQSFTSKLDGLDGVEVERIASTWLRALGESR